MKKVLMAVIAVAMVAMAGAAWAANSNTLTVSATVNGACKFSSLTSTLSFNPLDPSVGNNVTATTTTAFWCTKGVAETISADLGTHASGGTRQMLDSVSGDLIPYTLSLTPDGNTNQGPGSPRTLTIGGGIQGTDYISKTPGTYSDTVLLQINP